MNHSPWWYNKYVACRYWRELRMMAFARTGFTCPFCGFMANNKGKGLCLHHLTYERLGRENLDDLLVICGDCHYLVKEDKMPFQDVIHMLIPPEAVMLHILEHRAKIMALAVAAADAKRT